jgi:hypothetical protein
MCAVDYLHFGEQAQAPPQSLPPSHPQDSGGWTPIIWAAEHKHIDVIRMLLTRGADVTLTDNVSETGQGWEDVDTAQAPELSGGWVQGFSSPRPISLHLHRRKTSACTGLPSPAVLPLLRSS